MRSSLLLLTAASLLVAADPPRARTVVHLRRVLEPKESAFSMLVPRDWQYAGGVLRMSPLAPGAGPMNTISAKFDFAVKRDAQGTVAMHWLPVIYYKDPRHLTMPMAPGSNYMGMLVWPILDPVTFIVQAAFPREHPRAQGVRVLDRTPLPALAAFYQRQAPAMQGIGAYSYSAFAVTLAYTENGVAYKEKAVTVIEDSGKLGVGMWANRDTMFARAPAAEFDRLIPLFMMIQGSITPTPIWVEMERQGAAQRAHNALATQRYVSRVAAEIVENRRRTNAELAYSAWLNMTNREDYVNPYTGQVELGSNQWRNRWQAENGDVIYSDDDSYNPNQDPRSQRSDFKRSQIRQR